jgi:PRTRC genetic system ThiF family protein
MRGRGIPLQATIVLVGCGGTGGFLAESLCRLLVGTEASALYFVDPDRVAPRNVARQAFDMADVGQFKAQVLAERLSRSFGREIGYSVLPYEHHLHAEVFTRPTSLALIVGAVDNATARADIAATLDEGRYGGYPPPVFWLDAGNAHNSGQVLLGNALRSDQLRQAFQASADVCSALPAPSLQRPDLLASPPRPADGDMDLSCAHYLTDGDQGRTINQFMAVLVASFVERLLDGSCLWMASYADLTNGTLQCVPATPGAVSACTGLPVASLFTRQRGAAGR